MQCVSKKAYRFPIRYYGIKLWVIPSHFHLSKSKYQISSRANNSFPYDRPGITPIISNFFFFFPPRNEIGRKMFPIPPAPRAFKNIHVRIYLPFFYREKIRQLRSIRLITLDFQVRDRKCLQTRKKRSCTLICECRKSVGALCNGVTLEDGGHRPCGAAW